MGVEGEGGKDKKAGKKGEEWVGERVLKLLGGKNITEYCEEY